MANYHARGLTAHQWVEWVIYCREYLTPMQRADINAAKVQQVCGHWKNVPKLGDLLVDYGGLRMANVRRQTTQEQIAIAKIWAASTKRGK